MSLRPSTSRSYAAHVRLYLVPYLGGIPLADLTPGDVQAMFTAIIDDSAARGHPVGAATLRRIHATLRAGLNGAVAPGSSPGIRDASRNCPRWRGRGRRCGPRP